MQPVCQLFTCLGLWWKCATSMIGCVLRYIAHISRPDNLIRVGARRIMSRKAVYMQILPERTAGESAAISQKLLIAGYPWCRNHVQKSRSTALKFSLWLVLQCGAYQKRYSSKASIHNASREPASSTNINRLHPNLLRRSYTRDSTLSFVLELIQRAKSWKTQFSARMSSSCAMYLSRHLILRLPCTQSALSEHLQPNKRHWL